MKNETKLSERGITPSKVAYAYGISLETFQGWIRDSQNLSNKMEQEDKYLSERRKWTPKQLEMIFDEFGDPRLYQDIIESL